MLICLQQTNTEMYDTEINFDSVSESSKGKRVKYFIY